MPNALNSINLLSGTILPGINIVNYFTSSAAASRTDIYTAPAGKRALVYSYRYYNNTTSRTLSWELKSGGNYYYFHQLNNLVDSVAGALNWAPEYVLEPGESLALTASNTGIVVNIVIVEFNSAFPLYSPKLLTLASGDNTIYTVPSGKKALTGRMLNMSNTLSSVSQTIGYSNDSGGSRNVYPTYQPNGGSIYQVGATTAVADNVLATFASGHPGEIAAGDKLGINTNAATATQWAWVTTLEIPA